MTTPTKTPKQPQANYANFFSQLLHQLGIKGSPGALQGLADVVNTEGTNSYYNPFNIEYHPGDSLAYKGTGNYNSVGVQTYGSEAQGISATAAFLQGNANWQPLLDALRTGSKDKVDAAFSSIYTWTQFKPTDTQGAENILDSHLGTHSVDVNTNLNTGEKIVTGIDNVAGGAKDAIDSVPKLIKWITSPDNLIRVGFIVLGLFILLIGVDKLSGGGITGTSGGGTPTETLDVVVGNKPGNTRTVAGRATAAPSKAVKSSVTRGERAATTTKDTAKSAPTRAVEHVAKDTPK